MSVSVKCEDAEFAALCDTSKSLSYLLRHGLAKDGYENLRDGWYRFRDVCGNPVLNGSSSSQVRRMIEESRDPIDDSNRFEARFFIDSESQGGNCCWVRSLSKRGSWDVSGRVPQTVHPNRCDDSDWQGRSNFLPNQKGKGKGKLSYKYQLPGHFSGACPQFSGTTKRIVCTYWQNGSCNRGSYCTYAHGEDEIGQEVLLGFQGAILCQLSC